jgi:hypothetical protein
MIEQVEYYLKMFAPPITPNYKPNPTKVVGIRVGDRNKICKGCGHKNKKCSCGKYKDY